MQIDKKKHKVKIYDTIYVYNLKTTLKNNYDFSHLIYRCYYIEKAF